MKETDRQRLERQTETGEADRLRETERIYIPRETYRYTERQRPRETQKEYLYICYLLRNGR